jgi:hypothetical protein
MNAEYLIKFEDSLLSFTILFSSRKVIFESFSIFKGKYNLCWSHQGIVVGMKFYNKLKLYILVL